MSNAALGGIPESCPARYVLYRVLASNFLASSRAVAGFPFDFIDSTHFPIVIASFFPPSLHCNNSHHRICRCQFLAEKFPPSLTSISSLLFILPTESHFLSATNAEFRDSWSAIIAKVSFSSRETTERYLQTDQSASNHHEP